MVLVGVAVGMGWLKTFKGPIGAMPELDNGSSTLETSFSVTGFVRSSGLGKDQKSTLGLKFSDFQVTDFYDAESSYNEEVLGYFLESSSFEFDQYLGKCVTLEGSVRDGWKNISERKFTLNNQYTFRRSVVVPEKVSLKDFDICAKSFSEINVDKSRTELVVKGIIKRGRRPVPDIYYDYYLEFTGKAEELGAFYRADPPGIPKGITLLPSSKLVLENFEKNINQNVIVRGILGGGYVESLVFTVFSIEPEVDTSEWKTYRNEAEGFTFDYPSSWFVQHEDGGWIVIASVKEFSGTGADEPWFNANCSKDSNSEMLSLEELLKQRWGYVMDVYKPEKKVIVVNGVRGVQIVDYESIPATALILLVKDKATCNIMFDDGSEVSEKILSTLKFTDQ